MDNEFKMTPAGLAAMFDHTLLKPDAVSEDYRNLCRECLDYGFKAAVVNGAQVGTCRSLLEGSPVSLCAVVSFPLGQATVRSKLFEAEDAIMNGANEIDYVINISELKNGNFRYVKDEMEAIVRLDRQGGAITKVIFENCFLTQNEIETLCHIALDVGPDFIKTSTGCGSGGARPEDVVLMKKIAGDRVKVKAAGGIRDLDSAMKMIRAGAERIGASASVKILKEYISSTETAR